MQINLSIKKGDIVGLIGRNGSGKTVLMKCICGFLTPEQGRIKLRGKNVDFQKNNIIETNQSDIKQKGEILKISPELCNFEQQNLKSSPELCNIEQQNLKSSKKRKCIIKNFENKETVKESKNIEESNRIAFRKKIAAVPWYSPPFNESRVLFTS